MQLKIESNSQRGYTGASYQCGCLLEEYSLSYLDQRYDDKNVFTFPSSPCTKQSNTEKQTL